MKNEIFDQRGLSFLSLSHALNDVNQGAIPALLPFLVTQQHLSYVAASGIVLSATVISSILQPLLGYYSDRRPMPWLMVTGMLLSCTGIALSGIAASYWLTITCVLLCGAGVAAFHPEAFRFANYLSRKRPATGMSIFALGGNIGFALGPLMMTTVVMAFGLKGTLLMFLPTSLMALLLYIETPRMQSFRPPDLPKNEQAAENKPDWSAFIRLTIVIVIRASFYYGLVTFIPLYLINVRQTSITYANSALTVISLAGAIGALVGGQLADRFGQKRVMILAIIMITPLLLGFLNTNGIIPLFFLALIGMAMVTSFTAAIVIAQNYAPSNIGVASGIVTGSAIGLGGMTTPLFGKAADVYGVTTAFYIIVLLPLIAAAIALRLPVPPKQSGRSETA
ncbi:MAG: MFS transporter [Anaerolineae bacterium]|nr:MFS transporter [Anaerolineae bacterium]